MVSVALMMSISAVLTWMQWPRMVFSQNAVVLQPLDRAAAVVLQGVVDVVHALGDVDVIAHAAVVGLTMRSKVLSEMVNSAWPPNRGLSMSEGWASQ
jgi:hypothetical protein